MYVFSPATNTMINGHTQLAGQVFKLFGGTILGVNVTGPPPGYQTYALTGTTMQTLNVQFTASVANPVLLWGGHIASRLDWGPGNSASFISGSPYHMSQDSLYLNGSQVSGVGGMDRSIKAGVIVLPTIIVVNKVASPTTPNQNFGFT